MALVVRLQGTMDGKGGRGGLTCCQTLTDAGCLLHDAVDAMKDIHTCPHMKIVLLADATH